MYTYLYTSVFMLFGSHFDVHPQARVIQDISEIYISWTLKNIVTDIIETANVVWRIAVLDFNYFSRFWDHQK